MDPTADRTKQTIKLNERGWENPRPFSLKL